MSRIGIITITDNTNYGNRLQNYAVEKVLKKYNFMVETVWEKDDIITKMKNFLKILLPINRKWLRHRNIKKFTKKYISIKSINSYKNLLKYNNYFDYIIVGSDQIWNLKWQLNRNIHLLDFPSSKIISFAASFGISDITSDLFDWYLKIINHINHISVREYSGKRIITDVLKLDKSIYVLVDPTMLLTSEEWDKVSKKPRLFNKLNGKKYILNYFLGDLSEDRKIEIKRIAKENNCEIINILDKNDPFYVSGPSEFLYLEKNAFLICTDSFHSSVFAILYNKPFVVFDREQKDIENMNSRIDTLIDKFNLKNRRYNGKNITKENLEHDYTEAYIILEKERNKSKEFLEKALDIK